MSKFNDFSRFKNNELRSYLFGKEIEKYIQSKKKEKSKAANPFMGAIFSALITNFIAGVRGHISPEEYNQIIDTLSFGFINTTLLKIISYFLFAIILTFIFMMLYLFYMHYIQKVIEKWQTALELKKNAKKIQDSDDYKSPTEKHDLNYINKFNLEVVNQISLSLSIITHAEEESNNELEKRFYIGEAYRYLENATKILQNQIITSNFYSKIIEGNFTELNINRIKEILLLSRNLFKRIDEYWTSENIKTNYISEYNKLNNRLTSIDEVLSKDLLQ